VNLLEKQLSTVYFKDVSFPWDTLYNQSDLRDYRQGSDCCYSILL